MQGDQFLRKVVIEVTGEHGAAMVAQTMAYPRVTPYGVIQRPGVLLSPSDDINDLESLELGIHAALSHLFCIVIERPALSALIY